MYLEMNYKKKYLKYKLKYLTAKKIYGGSIPIDMVSLQNIEIEQIKKNRQTLNIKYNELEIEYNNLNKSLDAEYSMFNKIKSFIPIVHVKTHEQIFKNMKKHLENYNNLNKNYFENQYSYITQYENQSMLTFSKNKLENYINYLASQPQTHDITALVLTYKLQHKQIIQLLIEISTNLIDTINKQEQLNQKIQNEKQEYEKQQNLYKTSIKKIKQLFHENQHLQQQHNSQQQQQQLQQQQQQQLQQLQQQLHQQLLQQQQEDENKYPFDEEWKALSPQLETPPQSKPKKKIRELSPQLEDPPQSKSKKK